MRILVLGAGGSAGNNVSACFYSAGHVTIAADTDPIALQVARGAERVHVEPNRSAERLNEIIDEFDVDFVHAQPDAEVLWLAANQHLLNARTFLPDRATLFIAADKYRTSQVAGPDAPRSFPISDEKELERAIADLGGRAWLRLRSGAGSAGALPVEDASIARAWIQHYRTFFGIQADEWTIAEFLPGRNLSFTGVYRDGELLGFAMKERLRLLGASRSPANVSSTATLQVTLYRHDLFNAVHRIVERLQGAANGVLMFDFREDRNGVPKLTEINAGRFGTTSTHFLAAGGNLPALYAEAARGEPMSARGNVCRDEVFWYRDTDVGARTVSA
jgi:hypothetical protein